MKKSISFILSLLCLLSLSAVSGCGGDNEELQERFMKDVRRMSLIIHTEYSAPEDRGVFVQDVVTDEISFLPVRYELYCHAYMLFDGSMQIASADEVRALFDEFDEEAYERFRSLRDWYLLLNGSAYVDQYNDATAIARDLYNEKYGEDIMPGNWTAWSLEDRIALEDFVRNNPDLMPADKYENELRWLGIIP